MFKKGDKVVLARPNAFDDFNGAKKGDVFEVDRAHNHSFGGATLDLKRGGGEYLYSPYAAKFDLANPAAPPASSAPVAMRHNSGKPQLSYLLAFKGGIEALFGVTLAEKTGLSSLARWYQGGGAEDLALAIDEMLLFLEKGWESDMAAVCAFGEQKYARGNFLKGRSVSDSCDSLIRHLIALVLRGEKVDPESGKPHRGHIAWNILFIGHCAEEERFDDRLFLSLKEKEA